MLPALPACPPARVHRSGVTELFQGIPVLRVSSCFPTGAITRLAAY